MEDWVNDAMLSFEENVISPKCTYCDEVSITDLNGNPVCQLHYIELKTKAQWIK